MSIASWPSTLPQFIRLDSFSAKTANNKLRTNMNVGPAKVRRTSTSGVKPFSGSIRMTLSEYETIFEPFYRTTLVDGTLRFKWRNPLASDGRSMLAHSLSGVAGMVCTYDDMALVDTLTDISDYDNCRVVATDSSGRTATGYVRQNTDDESLVQMTYAASGSTGIQVADNDNLDFGTGNFALYFDGALPIWHNVQHTLINKRTGLTGYLWRTDTYSRLHIYLGGTLYQVKLSAALTNNRFYKLMCVVAQPSASVAGSVVMYVNGLAAGTTTIPAGSPIDVSSALNLYILGSSTHREAGMVQNAGVLNFAPTAAEVLSMFINGIPAAWQWGSQTPVYTSGFSSTETLTETGGTGAANIDGISDGSTSKDDCYRFYADGSTGYHYVIKAGITPILGHKYEIALNYLIPSTNTNLKRLSIEPYGGVVGANPQTVTGTWTRAVVTVTCTNTGALFVSRFGTASAWASWTGANSDTDDLIYFNGITVKHLGATAHYGPEGINTTNWQDSSTNNLDASYPATGYAVYPDGTAVRVVSEEDGLVFEFTEVDDGFDMASATYGFEFYDLAEMRIVEEPEIKFVSYNTVEVSLNLEIMP